MKHIFIINTIAGRGKYATLLPNIEKMCKEENLDYEIRYITEELSGKDIALEYKDEENVIYSVGGDGTLTRILQGIVGTKNKLAIIPSGSGNDTFRTIKKLPQGENAIDIVKINNTYFINVACTGLDAEVGNNIEVLRKTKIPTSQLYNASIIYTFFKYKFKKIKIKTSVKEIEDSYSILSICNGGYYGGGFNIAPKSQLTDGLLDIYYVEKMPKLKIIPLLLKLKKGKHEGKRKVHKFRTNHLELELEEEITFNVDGEKLTDKKFIIDILAKAITVYNNNELINKIIGGDMEENKKITHEEAMQKAVEESKANSANNYQKGGPFGAVIVKDGQIISSAHNTVVESKDATAHAEVNAIRAASEKLQTHDLSGCTLYTSAQPCPMCLSAIIWANIKEVYYANTKEDADKIGFRDDIIYEYLSGENKELINIKHIDNEEAIKVFESFAENSKKVIY